MALGTGVVPAPAEFGGGSSTSTCPSVSSRSSRCRACSRPVRRGRYQVRCWSPRAPGRSSTAWSRRATRAGAEPPHSCRCSLRGRPGALAVRVEAADEENLRRFQELVGGHVERFGRRERVKVVWRGGLASTAVPGSPARGAASTTAGAVSATGGGVTRRRWVARTTAVAAVGVLTVG
ncbi:DUF2218 domain-containing protein [Streptomyces sp. NPDC096311]|uniref:DUF2218 domain-containing protein n=1 Tax=Streptomyces sp. NPDC096311 TaxID=3366083 RepID=UPI0037F2A85D